VLYLLRRARSKDFFDQCKVQSMKVAIDGFLSYFPLWFKSRQCDSTLSRVNEGAFTPWASGAEPRLTLLLAELEFNFHNKVVIPGSTHLPQMRSRFASTDPIAALQSRRRAHRERPL
jgi:hypothetical protein